MEIVSLDDVHALFALQLHRAEGRKEEDGFDEIQVKEAFREALKYLHRTDFPVQTTAAYYAIEILKRLPFSRLNVPMARDIALEFLTKNGWKLHAGGLLLLESFINGRIHEEQIVEWFIRNARLPGIEEATVYVPEGTETVDLKSVPEAEVKAAYDKWVGQGYPNKDYGYKPDSYAIFARTSGSKELEIDVQITLSTAVDIAVNIYAEPEEGYPIDRQITTSVDAYETPVEAEPILKGLFSGDQRTDWEGIPPAVLASPLLKTALEEAWERFIALWRPPEHFELHTDMGAYDESISRSQFDSLQPGDRFYYKNKLYVAIKFHGEYLLGTIVEGNPTLNTDYPWGHYFWSGDRSEIELLPVEHEELHTDIGAYDESVGDLSEIRAKTVYAPPRSGKGLPALTAKRNRDDEMHREDYNSIVYDMQPGEIKIGRARLFAPQIAFSVKCFPNAKSENPYQEENAVKPLDGPPFYALTLSLRVRPARYGIEDLNIYVKRYFDASGTLCWAKKQGNLPNPYIFCPMGDLGHMEDRAFGDTHPSTDGHFFALASGSVADKIGTEAAKMNLWKLFTPYIRDLAKKPEVRELERPFQHVEHEELHTDIEGYNESLSREIFAISEIAKLEARRPKLPAETLDATPFVLNYETAQALEEKLIELHYFDNVIARWGYIEVGKNFRPVNPDHWYQDNFRDARLDLTIGRDRRYNLPQVIGIETNVYGLYNEKAKAKHGGWSYGYQKVRKLFPATAVPVNWPGPTCLAPSLDAALRVKLSDLCAEAYQVFVRALIPTVEHEELHTDVGGYDECHEKDA